MSKKKLDPELFSSPEDVANQFDAILMFIKEHYPGNGTDSGSGNLSTFLINRLNVVFTSEVDRVTLEKKISKRELVVLCPPVPKDEEDERTLFLLNAFGDLLIKTQQTATAELRKMVVGILSPEAKEKLIQKITSERGKK